MRNEKGFTLIEIIAVLVILGILAAVAVPKYIDLQTEAKIAAAKGQIAEMKSSANLTYAKVYLTEGTKPTVANIMAQLGTVTTLGQAPDNWKVEFSANGETGILLEVIDRNGDEGYAATGTWTLPQ